MIDKKVAFRVTNTTETIYTIRRTTQIAKFSAVTPEQSKLIKPVDTAILSMIPKGDKDLTLYLKKLLRTCKPQQQSNTSQSPALKSSGEIGDHTPRQTLIFKKLNDLNEKEKQNPTDNAESRGKILERFDCTDTLITELGKQALEKFLVGTMIFSLDTEWTRQ